MTVTAIIPVHKVHMNEGKKILLPFETSKFDDQLKFPFYYEFDEQNVLSKSNTRET